MFLHFKILFARAIEKVLTLSHMDIPIAANVLGTFGAVCWSIQANFFHLIVTSSLTQAQLIPQIIINYRRHHTVGLQQSMMLLWACAGVPLGAYNIASEFNIALQVQPQILTVLSLITWGQCFYYGVVCSNCQWYSRSGGLV